MRGYRWAKLAFCVLTIFFRQQEHPDADLQDVPADLVMASGSGLDPDVTLENAEFQLDRVAAKWADDTKRDAGEVRKEIDQILQANASAPFGGLVGEKFVNVLEVNLELCKRYGAPKWARAEFLWEGWVKQENRWELVPLVAEATKRLEEAEQLMLGIFRRSLQELVVEATALQRVRHPTRLGR